MKKKLLIVIIPIIILLIIAITLLVLYFTTDLFKTPSELFWKYLAEAKDVTNILENDNLIEQNTWKTNNTYTSDGDLSLIITQGENSSKQLNIATTARHDVNTGRTYADATLKNGDMDLMQVSYINSGDIYAIKCPEVVDTYIGIKNSGLKELTTKYGMSADGVPDSINFNELLNNYKITDEQKNHIINTYTPIIQKYLDESQYSKTNRQVTIFSNSFEADIYSISVPQDSLKQIITDSLNTLKNDTETLTLINNLNNLKNNASSDLTSTQEDITQMIDNMLEAVNQEEFSESLDISVYVNNGSTVRIMVNISDAIYITYDNYNSSQQITIDNTTIVESNSDNENNVFNLQEENTSNVEPEKYTTRYIITKNEESGSVINKFQIIPNTSIPEVMTEIEIRLGNLQSNYMLNEYKYYINNTEEQTQKIELSYTTNTSAASQVDEIMELSGSNTAIMNNYEPEAFKSFIQNWWTNFNNVLEEKMDMIGFTEIEDFNNENQDIYDRSEEAYQIYANDTAYAEQDLANVTAYIDEMLANSNNVSNN